MTDPSQIVMLVPDLMFATRIEDAARANGARVVAPTEQAGFLAALRDGARLAIIDANVRDVPWMEWVSAAKDDPATEAVPIIAFGSHVDVAQRSRALSAGVDRYLARSSFNDGVREIIAAAVRETTDQPCNESLPEGALEGIAEFNSGRYFEQHEVLELVWRAELRPVRDLYRGVLQIGLACLQIERGNAVGALKMIDRATRWLQPFRNACQAIDVDRMLEEAAGLRNEIERVGFDHLDLIDRALFPKVHLISGSEKLEME